MQIRNESSEFLIIIPQKKQILFSVKNEEEKRLYARQISECEQVISKLVNDSVKK